MRFIAALVLTIFVTIGLFHGAGAQSLPDITALKGVLDKPLPKPPAFLNEIGKWVKNFSSQGEVKDLGFSITGDVFTGLKEGIRDLRGFLGILIEFIPRYSRE
ncbi:MAG: hypothetical protein HYW80_00025 [Parcubacteria group bacterium]|nr:hypothetical protein [Parcubacteria group bacterium]